MGTTSYRDFIETLRGSVDIVGLVGDYVPLKKAGRRYRGLCPFHSEKTPSFSVDPEKELFYCFGCQAGGDVFRFVMLAERLEFPEAVRFLADRAGLPMPASTRGGGSPDRRERLLVAVAEAERYYRERLARPEGREARDYLAGRGLAPETVERLGLGFAPPGWDGLVRALTRRGHDPRLLVEAGLVVARRSGEGHYDRFRSRVVFPIRDVRGRTVGFGGRILGEGEPKYLNSPETPVYDKGRTLYGLWEARDAIRSGGRALLVEGYLDVAALLQAGVEGTVASCGTAFGEGHAKLLGRYAEKVVICFDGDRAGLTAAARSLDALLARGLHTEVVVLPEGRDPDDVVREEGAGGFQRRLEGARPFIDFLLDLAVRDRDLGRPGALVAALDGVLPHLARLESPIERSRYVPVVAERLGIEDDGLVAQALRKALREGRTRLEGRARALGPDRGAIRMKEAEQRLIGILVESAEARDGVLEAVDPEALGAPARAIVEALRRHPRGEQPLDWAELASMLPEGPKEALTKIAFRRDPAGGLPEAEACLAALRREKVERELARLQREIESTEDVERVDALGRRKLDLVRELNDLAGF